MCVVSNSPLQTDSKRGLTHTQSNCKRKGVIWVGISRKGERKTPVGKIKEFFCLIISPLDDLRGSVGRRSACFSVRRKQTGEFDRKCWWVLRFRFVDLLQSKEEERDVVVVLHHPSARRCGKIETLTSDSVCCYLILLCFLLPFSCSLFICLFCCVGFTFRQPFLSFFQFPLPLFSSHSLRPLSFGLFLFCPEADCISFSLLSPPLDLLLLWTSTEWNLVHLPEAALPGRLGGPFYSSCVAFSRSSPANSVWGFVSCANRVLKFRFPWWRRDGKSAVRAGSNLKWVSLPRSTLRPGETAPRPNMNSSVSCGQLFNMSLKHILCFYGKCLVSDTENLSNRLIRAAAVCLFSI